MTTENDAAAIAPPMHPVALPLAIAAGLGAAVAGAALWAVVTVLSNYEIGLMAVAIGFMVGRTIIAIAKHGNPTLGAISAVLSLLGCLLGNLLSAVGFAAQAWHADYFAVLTRLTPDLAVRLFTVSFGYMDLLFYAIGIYEGYRFAARR
jgi:hypothetical protein